MNLQMTNYEKLANNGNSGDCFSMFSNVNNRNVRPQRLTMHLLII